jgi:hypothetical protein
MTDQLQNLDLPQELATVSPIDQRPKSTICERIPLEELYQAAFLEGEGMGTAYEYFVKWRSLQRLFKFEIREILVLGLPEKYGASMDFVLLADHQGCGVTIVDDRSESINKCKTVLRELKERDLISKTPRVIQVNDLPGSQQNLNHFDLVLSCEVLQRLPASAKREYVRTSLSVAKYAAVFVPNQANTAHARISKLQAMQLSELRNLFNDYMIVEEGYVDMPPFPPGLKRNTRGRARGRHQALRDKIIIQLLNGWSTVEREASTCFREPNSHIVFVMARAPSNEN